MKKICIIKLGAKGDVVRTLSILPAIKKKYPESEITWITKQNISHLLQDHPLLDKTVIVNGKITAEFDVLYNFDIEEDATTLAKKINAKKKYGFYSEGGFPCAFNAGAEYYLNTLFDDELKKQNTKTYQHMMFDAAELPYHKESFEIHLTEKDKKYAEDFIKKNTIDRGKLIGIHMGAGKRWPSKAWSQRHVKEFIKKARRKGYEILLFGGPDEIEPHKDLIRELKKENITVYQNNPNNTEKEFASLVSICQKIVCSDSFALHVATALHKQSICLFFVTSPNEVEDYGLIKKIVSPLLVEFFPQKSDQYSEELVNSITADQVLEALE